MASACPCSHLPCISRLRVFPACAYHYLPLTHTHCASARLFFEPSHADWHYTGNLLGGVSIAERVRLLGLHAADTALMPADDEQRRQASSRDRTACPT